MSKKLENQLNIQTRPPIVVVMGHVDHGKTTLLDFIRKTKVAEKEAGGITQAIGAYEIAYKDKPITFIDTPGHEAFSKMRSRGAHVADVAVLVVAADDGVKPQTVEAIHHITESKIPFVVAINKIDKPGVQADRVKKELAEKNVFVEQWGGSVPCAEISAKTGQGIDELLEMILLLAEMEELKGEPHKNAEGVVIEAYLDSQRGPVATFLVEDGALNLGDYMVIGSTVSKIKLMEDFLGRKIDKAVFSQPVLVIGLAAVPSAGDEFFAEKNKTAAEQRAEEFKKQEIAKPILPSPPKEEAAPQVGETAVTAKFLNIVLKSDVKGSEEALADILEHLDYKNVKIRLLKKDVGDVNESDVRLADLSNAVIIGFRVKVGAEILNLIRDKKIKVLAGEIIYEFIDKIRKLIDDMTGQEIVRVDLGKVQVLAIFRTEKGRMIVGGRVTEGKLERGARAEVFRAEQKIGEGKIAGLQSEKKEVGEAGKGKECGVLFDGDIKIEVNDILLAFREEKQKTL
ncbi:translation initiation factor IF-2 [Candidatus Azambacteria bacterium RIFCSPLOWO2_02_FULL_46_11]|uniref:Translation initiation factor IF-2 n=3 Tax=Candidatus Azamiibacteriota TaxID=1752741 RepID=A0A1F5C9F9_9BACT|nr:MAG: translation initiation factor IF-2 [Candidatus Azambacteria bacterium RIFCSPHIGHO2_02_46_12]OGD39468.1 MAG: translation initiation factor IF-2 [Candidatus Azambacteria bacterium RIFCSPLOWO2_01_FULL_46_26]OGD45016.1 MAG: translation initiation factor IF-2 [Candidatus Azambacteria bacterium RIFCSPLOWO2_02_FULL_46_11]